MQLPISPSEATPDCIVFRGTIVSGFEMVGLWPTESTRPAAPSFPAEHWPVSTEVDTLELHGPGWITHHWLVSVPHYPDASTLQELLRAALDRLVGSGAVMAWAASEANFADPPDLFNPEVMGTAVFAALSPATGFVLAPLAQPMQEWIPRSTYRILRELALRSVDLTRPDVLDGPQVE